MIETAMPGAAPGELLADQHPVEAPAARAAVLLGHVRVHQPDLVRLRDHVDRVRRVLVVLGRLRPDLLLRELARERAQLLLLVRQRERDPPTACSTVAMRQSSSRRLTSQSNCTRVTERDATRDVALVLSGGGVNGVMMELGFLRRLRESALWPRVGWIFGTSAGALAGVMAALDRLDDLEASCSRCRRPTCSGRTGSGACRSLGIARVPAPGDDRRAARRHPRARRRAGAQPDRTGRLRHGRHGHDRRRRPGDYELVYSSRSTEPDEMAQAILASGAISTLVMPVRVGERIATDGGWLRNFPLAHAYHRPGVERIVAFRYLPRYTPFDATPLATIRRRLGRFGRVPPVRALIEELKEAEAREARGEPRAPARHDHAADADLRPPRLGAGGAGRGREGRRARRRSPACARRSTTRSGAASPTRTSGSAWPPPSQSASATRTSRSAATGTCPASPSVPRPGSQPRAAVAHTGAVERRGQAGADRARVGADGRGARGRGRRSADERGPEQVGVQADDDRGDDARRDRRRVPVDELAHHVAAAREQDHRDERERDPEREHDLRDDERVRRREPERRARGAPGPSSPRGGRRRERADG